MTSAALERWMATCSELQKEMEAEREPQALMVAAVLLGLQGSIAAFSLGDESPLRELYAASTDTARRFLQEHPSFGVGTDPLSPADSDLYASMLRLEKAGLVRRAFADQFYIWWQATEVPS